jgi:hypothetical protein
MTTKAALSPSEWPSAGGAADGGLARHHGVARGTFRETFAMSTVAKVAAAHREGGSR